MVLAISFVVSIIATPISKIISKRFRILDKPNQRKIHKKPMPTLGGLAIFLGFVAAILFSKEDSGAGIILLGGTVMLLVGAIDDKMKMGPKMKFLLPSIAAIVLIFLGVRTNFLPNTTFDLFNIIFSFIWIIGIVNAFNFIDNMDGLSIGTAFFCSLFFFLLALISNQNTAAVISIALAGACLGFLPYNFKPASIFAGDSGSMFAGFVLASVAIFGNWNSQALTTSLLIPILVLGYPIFDVTLVTFLRILHKKRPWVGDKNHSSHRLVKLGFTEKKSVLILYAISLCLGLTAFITSQIEFAYGVGMIIISGLFLLILGTVLCIVPFEDIQKR